MDIKKASFLVWRTIGVCVASIACATLSQASVVSNPPGLNYSRLVDLEALRTTIWIVNTVYPQHEPTGEAEYLSSFNELRNQIVNSGGRFESSTQMWISGDALPTQSDSSKAERFFNFSIHRLSGDGAADQKTLNKEVGPGAISLPSVKSSEYVIANRTSLSTEWTSPFIPRNTYQDKFVGAQRTSSVPFMHRDGSLTYISDADGLHIKLGLKGGLSLIVRQSTKPDVGKFDVNRLLEKTLTPVLTNAHFVNAHLALPKFEAANNGESDLGLINSHGGALGLPSLNSARPPIIIMQFSRVNFSEFGLSTHTLTLAARTRVLTKPAPPVTVKIDRPFEFCIVDDATRTPLYFGHVSNIN